MCGPEPHGHGLAPGSPPPSSSMPSPDECRWSAPVRASTEACGELIVRLYSDLYRNGSMESSHNSYMFSAYCQWLTFDRIRGARPKSEFVARAFRSPATRKSIRCAAACWISDKISLDFSLLEPPKSPRSNLLFRDFCLRPTPNTRLRHHCDFPAKRVVTPLPHEHLEEQEPHDSDYCDVRRTPYDLLLPLVTMSRRPSRYLDARDARNATSYIIEHSIILLHFLLSSTLADTHPCASQPLQKHVLKLSPRGIQLGRARKP